MSNYTSMRIFECQKIINELQKLQNTIKQSEDDNVRFLIQTKHWYGWREDSVLLKKKTQLNFSKETIIALIDAAIQVQKERIDNALEFEANDRKRKI